MSSLEFVFTGDLVLDEPDPDHWLGGIADTLRAADVAIGHLEVPHSHRGVELQGDVPAPGADPAHLSAVKRAGFAAVSLAGNHMTDLGAFGIADTRAELERLGIHHAGAGANLSEASRPAFMEASGRRIALLSFNCVGPESSWATLDRAGCAYVRVETADGSPIAPAAPLERANPDSMAAMQDAIRSVRAQADVIVVALHKGIVHTPARLAPYEQPIAWAAIDAGCDIVLGHHAHIVRGIEIYRDRPIFHGLGNGCVVTRALSPNQSHAARAAWARKRRELFGFEPDPAYELAPFHPQAVNAMLGRVRVHADGRLQAGFAPVHVEPPGRPTLAHGATADRVISYVERITTDAGLTPLIVNRSGDDAWLN
jgi:poly-gamma-glutamate capsule biosynthesis protein CapA/YwtB (metallophosphatase superfamily)